MTLMKGRSHRVALVGMHDGAKIESHRTENAISLQVLEGTIKFSTDSGAVTLKKGSFLTVQAGILHHVDNQCHVNIYVLMCAGCPIR